MTAKKTSPKDTAPENAPAETTPGWDLLNPLEDMYAWDLLDAYAELAELFEGVDATDARTQMKAFAAIARCMRGFAKDEAEFGAFAKGSAGLARTVELAGAWMVELGKSVRSVA